MDPQRHPGISMHKLPVGGGFIGLVFAVGCAAIFVIGFPSLWYFVALSAALGIGIAVLLRLMNRRSSDRNRPLSILAAPARKDTLVPLKPKQPGNFFQTLPKPFST